MHRIFKSSILKELLLEHRCIRCKSRTKGNIETVIMINLIRNRAINYKK